jgi:hypothetical protein
MALAVLAAAAAAGCRGACTVPGQIAIAALAAVGTGVAVSTAFASGLGGQLMIPGKTTILVRYVPPAPAPSFGCAPGIVFKITPAGPAALAGNVPLLLLIHRCKATVRRPRLTAI